MPVQQYSITVWDEKNRQFASCCGTIETLSRMIAAFGRYNVSWVSC